MHYQFCKLTTYMHHSPHPYCSLEYKYRNKCFTWTILWILLSAYLWTWSIFLKDIPCIDAMFRIIYNYMGLISYKRISEMLLGNKFIDYEALINYYNNINPYSLMISCCYEYIRELREPWFITALNLLLSIR